MTFSKGQCTDHCYLKNRFENISQRKMKQILKEFFMNSLGKLKIVEKVYSSLTEVILGQNFMGANIVCTFFDIHSVFQSKWVKR